MVWCKYCALKVSGARDNQCLYCDVCGKVLESFNFSEEATFVKNAAGQSQLSGNFVRTVQSDISASHERTLNRVYEDMRYMGNGLNMGDNEEIVRVALAIYKEKQQKRATEVRNSSPAQTGAEATREMLTKKRLSSKINYDVLDKLFDEYEAPETKKKRNEPHSENDEEIPNTAEKDRKLGNTDNNDGLENEYDDERGMEEAYGTDLHGDSPDEAYDYENDYGDYDEE